MKLLKLVVIFLLVGLGALFAPLYPGSVRLDVHLVAHGVPVALALVIALALGALLGSLGSASRLATLRQKLGAVRRQTRLSAQEVSNLRALPLRDR